MPFKTIYSLVTLGALMISAQVAAASDVLELTFNRTGTTASTVTVNASGIEGVTASVTSVSTAMKTTAGSVTSAILCPNVNANTSPTITIDFQISGLPAGFTIDDLNLDIHALNGNSGYQQSSDNVTRQFNVAAAINGSTIGSLNNIDIAAGVNPSGTERHKIWTITPASPVTPGSPLNLKLTITKGTTNGGCFFGLSAVRFNTPTPEVCPFTPSTSLASASAFYFITNADGKVLDSNLTWTDKKPDATNQWCFIGASNAAGGYQIMNTMTATAIGGDKRFTVDNGQTEGFYTFTDSEGNKLEITGCSEFRFSSFRARNEFALAAQIYALPCGTLGSNYITSVTVGSTDGYTDLRYPMAITSGSSISYPLASRPSARYTMLSRDHATVAAGELPIDLTLNTAPSAADRVFAYFDWDRDGYFEDMIEIPAAKTMHSTFTVPATAKAGQSRMRIRLTSNDMTDADDDVAGQVLDLYLTCIDANATKYDPEVSVNSPGRGKASYDSATHTAKAERNGSSTFLYWKEDKRIHSVDAQCEIAPTPTRRKFVAVFSPNLDDPMSGIEMSRLDNPVKADISSTNRIIEVVAAEDVELIMVFSLNGAPVLIERDSATADASQLLPGLYIVKAITFSGTATAKIILD